MAGDLSATCTCQENERRGNGLGFRIPILKAQKIIKTQIYHIHEVIIGAYLLKGHLKQTLSVNRYILLKCARSLHNYVRPLDKSA